MVNCNDQCWWWPRTAFKNHLWTSLRAPATLNITGLFAETSFFIGRPATVSCGMWRYGSCSEAKFSLSTTQK